MRSARLLAVTFLISIATPAIAADWWLVGESGSKPNRYLVWIDRSSLIKRSQTEVEAWLLTYYETPKDGFPKSDKSRYIYDCKQRTMALRQTVGYDDSGSRVSGFDFDDPPDSVIPESDGEAQWRFACFEGSGNPPADAHLPSGAPVERVSHELLLRKTW